MDTRNIVVIGASAGGFHVLKQLVAGLPADLDAAVFIVWHMPPEIKGILPQVLNRQQTLPAAHAVNREPIASRRIYVAPPDMHLVLEKEMVRVTRGPRENGFRPAVDPLFRSAAYQFGPRVIGIVLSGALDDGTAGLWTIKQYGGIAIAQDPSEAEVASMPMSAIREVPVDHIVPVSQMPKLLVKLTSEPLPAFTLSDMENRNENIEQSMWNSIRAIEESIILLNHMGDHFAEVNKPHLAAQYFKKAREAQERNRLIRQALPGNEQLSVHATSEEAGEDEAV